MAKIIKKETPESLENKVLAEFIKAYHEGTIYSEDNTPGYHPPVEERESYIVPMLREAYANRNNLADKNDQWTKPVRLSPQQIAQCMIEFDHCVLIDMTDNNDGTREGAILSMYIEDSSSPAYGTYTDDERIIGSVIDKYSKKMRQTDVKGVYSYLHNNAPMVQRTKDPYLTAVNNGVFNWKTKELLDFSPEYVFTSKITTNYNPNAQNVHLTCNDGFVWDCDYQIESTASDKEQLRFHWQMLTAATRPFISWNKAIFPYSPSGCNGKGTIATLIRNMLGSQTVVSLNLDAMSGDKYCLADLRKGPTCIIGDENPVGTFIDKSDTFKSLVTHDPVRADAKYRDASQLVFHGLIIQCLNEMPRIHDRSNSLLRRCIFDEYKQSFEGKEYPEIKDDFLKRTDVLEYYLYRALNDDCESFDVPSASERLNDEYKAFNSPIDDFWATFKTEFKWTVLPKDFLYEVYKSWFAINNPNGAVVSCNNFWQELMSSIGNDDKTWAVHNGNPNNRYQVNGGMNDWEPLIATYKLAHYINPYMPTTIDIRKKFDAWNRPTEINKCLYRR